MRMLISYDSFVYQQFEFYGSMKIDIDTSCSVDVDEG